MQINMSTDSPFEYVTLNELSRRTLGDEAYEACLSFFCLDDRTTEGSYPPYTKLGDVCTFWVPIPGGYSFVAWINTRGDFETHDVFQWRHGYTIYHFTRCKIAEQPQANEYEKPTDDVLAEVDALIKEIEGSTAWEEVR